MPRKYGMILFIHSYASTVQPLKFNNGWVISSDTFWACNYLSKLGLQLIHISESGH